MACIKVASQAVATMPTLLFWPLVPFLALCCLIVYWVAVAAFLYSAGDIKPTQLTASSSGPYSLAVSSASFHQTCITGRACVHGCANSIVQKHHEWGTLSCACRCCMTHQPTRQHLFLPRLWHHSLPTSQMLNVLSVQTAILQHLSIDRCNTCSFTTSSACSGPTSLFLGLGKHSCPLMGYLWPCLPLVIQTDSLPRWLS